jgi:hypothetical protein
MLGGTQTPPNPNPVPPRDSRTDPQTERNAYPVAKGWGKYGVFAVVLGVIVTIVVVAAYLRSTGRQDDSRIARARSAQGSIPESDPLENKAKAGREPAPTPSKTGITQTPDGDQSRLFVLRAVIKDPDGYTNVRRMKSASSEIVTKVFDGQEFYTHAQDGAWWQIKTKDGKLGYMHVSRIRVLR